MNNSINIVEISSLEQLIERSKYNKSDIADRMNISRRYLYTLLQDEDKMSLAQYKSLLDILGYTINMNIIRK